MNADQRLARQLAEKMADDRAHRIATIAAEEFVRCNGLSTDTPDQFVFHGADLSDEHFQECVAHLKWVGECVVFEREEEMIVQLGARLGELLDEDHWAECERLLLEGWAHDEIDRKTGRHWRENSDLEVWFPMTAEELERLRAENAQLRHNAEISRRRSALIDLLCRNFRSTR